MNKQIRNSKRNTEEIRGFECPYYGSSYSPFPAPVKGHPCCYNKNLLLRYHREKQNHHGSLSYHNDQMKSLIDKEYSFGTPKKYATALNHPKEYS